MQIDVSICSSTSYIRSVSRSCIININAVKLSHLKKEDSQLEWAKHMDDYGDFTEVSNYSRRNKV